MALGFLTKFKIINKLLTKSKRVRKEPSRFYGIFEVVPDTAEVIKLIRP